MSINLRKGQSVNLRKDAPNLKQLYVGLGWDPVKTLFGPDIDIDASIICIDENDLAEFTVYYGATKHPSGAILHYGDNLTGEGDGDDEVIEIDLNKLPNSIVRLAVIINIYEAYHRKQHFGKVNNCFVHVTDKESGNELVRYDVDGNYDNMTGIFVADIYRYKGEWKFKAIGEGVRVKNIAEMIRMKCR